MGFTENQFIEYDIDITFKRINSEDELKIIKVKDLTLNQYRSIIKDEPDSDYYDYYF